MSEIKTQNIRKRRKTTTDNTIPSGKMTFKPKIPLPFKTVGLFTFLRTYARRHNESDPDSTIETWQECLTRVVNACNDQLKVGFTKKEMIELFDLLYGLKCSVAGRFMWQLGTRTVDRLGIPSLQNCAQTVVNHPITPFTWAMNFLMLGAGVGYRILPSDVQKLPKVHYALIARKDTKDADFIVPDSREGWIKLLGKVLKTHFYGGGGFTYSCICLRSKGAPIKSFGGVASGPDVLCEGMTKISNVLNKRAGMKLRPIDALDIMNIIGMIVVSGNVRRCLPKDSLVHTKRGLVPIQNIVKGDKVLTSYGYHNVSNTFKQGEQKLVKIITEDGEFECTPNHKMAVLTPNDTRVWKIAADLRPDDYLITCRKTNPGMNVVMHEAPGMFITIPDLDEDMAWFLGVLFRAGYTSQNNIKPFTTIILPKDKNEQVVSKITHQMRRFGRALLIKIRRDESSIIITSHYDDLAIYLDAFVKKPGQPLKTPQQILRASPSIRLAYVAGVHDANGEGLEYSPGRVVTMPNRDFVKEVQTILYSCGIESKFTDAVPAFPSRRGWIPYYSLHIVTQSAQEEFCKIAALTTPFKRKKFKNINKFPFLPELDEVLCHKYGIEDQKSLDIDTYDKIKPNGFFCPTKVTKIPKFSRTTETYDIEVEDVHEFFCNGYLTHNSAQIALGDVNDKEYLAAKDWGSGKIPNWRAYSNNSVVCNDINDIIDDDDFWKGYEGHGEPYGLINLGLHQKIGRLGETQYVDPDVTGINPCSEISLSSFETCVKGDTRIQTYDGCPYIKDVVGKEVKVFNGSEWSKVKPFLANPNDTFMRIGFSDGSHLDVTPYHEFSVSETGEKFYKLRADKLQLGMYLPTWELGTLDRKNNVNPHKLGVSERSSKNNYLSEDAMSLSGCDLRRFLSYWKNLNDASKTDEIHIESKFPGKLKDLQILLRRCGINNTIIKDNWIELSSFGKQNPQRITSIENLPGTEPSYCFSEPLKHMGVFNNVLTHQCCLSELFLPNIKTEEELNKCTQYLYRICKHSLTLPCFASKETEQIVHKNMRIGIGVTGYLQSTEEQKGWLDQCYKNLREFDKKYSRMKGFPTSIKLTTFKPSGTLSLLAGVTSGIHPGYSQYYIRRVRIASESPLIKLAMDHGYYVEPVKRFDGTNDHTTMVIEFPYSLPEHTIFANNCSAIQQLEYVKRAQKDWSDNAISVTVTYRKEELPGIKEWLRKNYNQYIKSVSFLLYSGHGFLQAPIEPITKEKYDEMMKKCRPITSIKGVCYTEEPLELLSEMECSGGACPLR